MDVISGLPLLPEAAGKPITSWGDGGNRLLLDASSVIHSAVCLERLFSGAKTLLQCGYCQEEDVQRTEPNSGCWRPTCASLSRQWALTLKDRRGVLANRNGLVDIKLG